MDPNQNQPPQPAPNQEPTPPTPNQNPFAQPSTDALSPTPPAPASEPSVVQPTLSPNPIVPTPQTSTPTNPGPITPFVSDPRQTAAAQPTVFFSKDPVVAQPPKKSKKKRILIATGTTIAVFALASAAVFGLYLPNTEANVWNTGLNRTGKAMNELVVSATEKEQLQSYKSSEIGGNIEAKFGGGSYSGDFTAKFDDKTTDGGINIAIDSEESEEIKLGANILSEISGDNTYPDIFFQLNGIKDLGLDMMLPGISEYDGKWISADAKYIESLTSEYTETEDTKEPEVTAEEIAELARAVSLTTQDYVFTTNPDKAVFKKKEFVGKEQVDNIDAYHYKVTVNTNNAKAYCGALVDTVQATKVYKKFVTDETEVKKDKESAIKECNKTVDDSIKSTDTFDLWIDKKYKLIHKFRVYSKDNKQAYTDIGQTYKGGDELSLFVKYVDDKSKTTGTFTLDTNIKTNATKALIDVAGGDGDNAYSVKVTMQAKSLSGDVKIEKPTNTISLEEVIKKFEQQQEADSSPADSEDNTSMDYESAYELEPETDGNFQ